MNRLESFPSDLIKLKVEAARKHFHSCCHGQPEQISVAGIGAVPGGKSIDIRPAQARNQHTSCLRNECRKFLQVLLAPLGHRVREECNVAVTPGGVFDFEVDGALIVCAVVWGEQ